MEIHWAKISAVILAENSEEHTRYVDSKANSECPLAYPMAAQRLFERLRLHWEKISAVIVAEIQRSTYKGGKL
jgi:hypothetical protein